MAIEGPISELNLIDLFQILSFNQKTGVLGIDSSENEKAKVYFENGHVIFVSIEGQHIGLAMIKSGKINKEDYEEKLMKSVGTNETEIAKEAIKIGIFAEDEFRKFLKTRIEDSVYKLFEWHDGYFKFEEGGFILEPLFKFRIKTESLIMEGSRRIDEWSRLSSKIPSSAIVPRLSENPEKIDVLDLKPKEWEILAMINGSNSIKDIADKYGDEFEIAKLIYGMITLGIVITDGAGEAKVGIDQLAVAKQYYNDGLYDKAIIELKSFIKDDQKNPEAFRMICASYYALHQFDKINDYAAIAQNNSVNDLVLKKYSAVAFLRRGEIEKSIENWIYLYDMLETPEDKKRVENLVGYLRESLKLLKELSGGFGE